MKELSDVEAMKELSDVEAMLLALILHLLARPLHAQLQSTNTSAKPCLLRPERVHGEDGEGRVGRREAQELDPKEAQEQEQHRPIQEEKRLIKEAHSLAASSEAQVLDRVLDAPPRQEQQEKKRPVREQKRPIKDAPAHGMESAGAIVGKCERFVNGYRSQSVSFAP
jgi:hypothetical protein